MKKLGLLLLEIGQEEREVNIMRQVLLEQDPENSKNSSFISNNDKKTEFRPFDLFRYMSCMNGNGHIGHKDLSKFLKHNNIIHNKFEAACMVRALDIDEDGSIGYADFLNFIGYKGHTKKISNKADDNTKIPVNLEYALARLFERELEAHRKLEGLKDDLIKKSKLSIQDTYFRIPITFSKSGISFKNLRYFLDKECGFDVLEEELKGIMKRLDRDQDGVISCSDFASTVLPLHINKNEAINTMNSYFKELKEEYVSTRNIIKI